MMTRPFDVVIVPDFRPGRAHVFEAQTLFFLASWLEHAGRARDFPLHLACIGEAPASVRVLAERCGASLTFHDPVRIGDRGTPNKLRGLEVRGRTDRVLLLDTDVCVLSDPSELGAMDFGVVVAPAAMPRPERCWQQIYQALSMTPPRERIACLSAELGRPLEAGATSYHPERLAELDAMLPYYNGGIVFLPWDSGLRPLWEEHLRTIAASFSGGDPAWRHLMDENQAGLATAIEVLKRRGVAVLRLSHALHATPLHLFQNALRVSDIKLFHAFRFCSKVSPAVDDLARQPRRYRNYLLKLMRNSQGDHGVAPDSGAGPSPAAERLAELETALQTIYERHLAPLMHETHGHSGRAAVPPPKVING
jgi:hypothetical protein